MTSPRSLPRLFLFTLAALPFSSSALQAEARPLRQLIDAELQAAWKREKITPSVRSSDAAFLRRLYLDLVGTIPTASEATQFLADSHAKKRDRVIDKLLADPRFAGQQADVWDLVLFGRFPPNLDGTKRHEAFRKWLADKFARNVSYDQWVRDLLLAEQPSTELFYVQHRGQPEDMAVAVSRIFLGTQLQCARCHDHPYETWKQRDFYGMAGFFVRLVVLDKTVGRERGFILGEKSTGDVLFTGAVKDRRPGRQGEPIKPRFLDGKPLDEPALPKGFKETPIRQGQALPKPLFSRKAKLAAWVTGSDNPFLARAVVNRVWSQFFGRGLVHPVDDLSEKNAPSHPELFKALVEQFTEHKFDLKWLIRELVGSDAYQLSGIGPMKDAMPDGFARARVRPLSAEELLAAIRTATAFDASGQKMRGDTIEYALRYFGEPTNGRGEFQGGLQEHLFLNNSDNIRTFLRRYKGNLTHALLASTEAWEKRVDRLFLSVLSRPPSNQERAKFVAHLTSELKADALVEEAIWVLLNTAEFRFNH
jgi:hypothetical protein